MRTTLTLDADVARLIDDEVHRRRRPFKQIVNDAIRRGLSPRPADRKVSRFRVTAFVGGLQAGIDSLHLNRVADELEDEEYVAQRRREQP